MTADPGDSSRAEKGRRARQSESPLGWLGRRRDKSGKPLITPAQREAGERLAAQYRLAELMPRTTMSWDPLSATAGRGGPGRAVDLRDRAAEARLRINRALAAVGPDFANVLVDVCCHEKGLEQLEREAGWPERSAKIVIQYALNALARHFGLLPADTSAAGAGAAEIRHWGAPGYRPSLDGN